MINTQRTSLPIETPTGHVLRRNHRQLKENFSNSDKTLTLLPKISQHHTKPSPTKTLNTYSGETSSIHANTNSPSGVTTRSAHKTQPSDNTSTEITARLGRVITPHHQKIEPIKNFHTWELPVNTCHEKKDFIV